MIRPIHNTAPSAPRQAMEWRPSFALSRRPRIAKHDVSRHSKDWSPYNPALGRLGQSAAQDVSTAGSLATNVSTSLIQSGIADAEGIVGSVAALAGPIGAIAGSLISLLTQIFSGCGQACVLESNAANQLESLLQQNVAAYMSSGHTKSEQAAALVNFDNTWAKLVQYCGNASFGQSGQNCITDRQAGSCKWKTSPGGWQQDSSGNWNYVYNGAAGSGSTCWNWFVGYRDPIAKDPTVVPDAVSPATATAATGNSVSSEVSNAWSQLTGGGANLGPIVLIGGLILLAVLL